MSNNEPITDEIAIDVVKTKLKSLTDMGIKPDTSNHDWLDVNNIFRDDQKLQKLEPTTRWTEAVKKFGERNKDKTNVIEIA